jgi:23S rRNA pseudouridine2605 synthase
MIAARRIAVDGVVLESPAFFVVPGQHISVDGRPVGTKEPTRLWRYHKPRGLLTTNRDPQGRPTIFEHLPKHLPRVVTIGRLDMDSEGLLLLTNDGALARQLELPAHGWQRRYRVRIHGRPAGRKLAALQKGVTIAGMSYRAIAARFERQTGANSWLSVTLTEGKNREVRKIFDSLGCPVNRLIRVAFGPFELGALAAGQVEEVPAAQVKKLF